MVEKIILKESAVRMIIDRKLREADWICGALFRYYNKRRNGDKFYATIKNSIIAQDELFKDYWTNKKSR